MMRIYTGKNQLNKKKTLNTRFLTEAHNGDGGAICFFECCSNKVRKKRQKTKVGHSGRQVVK